MGAKLDWIARARLASGVVLFVFVASHLLNHALGNISLATMEAGRGVFLAVWRNPVGGLLLYISLVTHFGLVLYTIYQRRTLRMPVREALQIVAGLAIPPLLTVHVIGTRGLHQFFDVNDLYAYVVMAIWVFEPVEGLKQTAALLIAWFHGCVGLHYWLKLKALVPQGRRDAVRSGTVVARLCVGWLRYRRARSDDPDARPGVAVGGAIRRRRPRRGRRRLGAGRNPRTATGGWRSFLSRCSCCAGSGWRCAGLRS